MDVYTTTVIWIVMGCLVTANSFANEVRNSFPLGKGSFEKPHNQSSLDEKKEINQRSSHIQNKAYNQAYQATAIKSDPKNTLNFLHPFVQALKNAYASNPDLHAAIRKQFATVEKLNQAYSGWRPNISAAVDQNFTNTNSDGNKMFNPHTSDNPTDSTSSIGIKNRSINSSTQARLTITQNLFNGWQTLNGVDQAKNDILAGESTVVNAEQQLLLDSIKAYLELWKAKKTLELRLTSERFNQSSADLLSAQHEVGEKTSIELAESNANYANAVANRLDAEAALEDAYAKYVQIIGNEPPQELTPPPNVTLHYPLPKTVTELSERAQYTNPSILAALYAMKAAEFAINIADGKLLPSLDASASGTRNISRDSKGRYNSSYSHTRSTQGAVGFSLKVPIYQNGNEWSGIRQSVQEYYFNKNRYNSTKRAVIQQVQSVWKAWKSAEKSIDQYKIAVKAYELNREGKLEEYKVGTLTLTDTLRAESQLVETQVNLIQAEQKYLLTGYQLMALYGDLLPESLNLPIQRYNIKDYQDNMKTRIAGTGDLYENLEFEKVLADSPVEPLNVHENITRDYGQINADLPKHPVPLS